jgi:hypothetical protein
MLTQKTVFHKKNPFMHPLDNNRYRIDRNGIPEKEFGE